MGLGECRKKLRDGPRQNFIPSLIKDKKCMYKGESFLSKCGTINPFHHLSLYPFEAAGGLHCSGGALLGITAGQVLGFNFFHLSVEASVLRVAVEQPGQEGFERRISLNFGGGVHDEVATHL